MTRPASVMEMPKKTEQPEHQTGFSNEAIKTASTEAVPEVEHLAEVKQNESQEPIIDPSPRLNAVNVKDDTEEL